MGMRFTKVKAADQAAIDEFVDAHFFRSVKLRPSAGVLQRH